MRATARSGSVPKTTAQPPGKPELAEQLRHASAQLVAALQAGMTPSPPLPPSPPIPSFMVPGRTDDIRAQFAHLAKEVLLTEREAGRIAGFSPLTLKHWRLNVPGKGPKATIVRGSVRYRVADLKRWLAEVSGR